MPKPTIQQIFGDNASVTSNQLTVRFSDLSDTGWDTAAGTTDAEKWFTAILLKVRDFSANNTDQLNNVNVNAPYPGLIMRNNVLKRQHSYSVEIFVPDSGNVNPDPDLV